jgi:hypothetical protein
LIDELGLLSLRLGALYKMSYEELFKIIWIVYQFYLGVLILGILIFAI